MHVVNKLAYFVKTTILFYFCACYEGKNKTKQKKQYFSPQLRDKILRVAWEQVYMVCISYVTSF